MPVIEIGSIEAYQKVINSGHTIIVDFYAIWCGPCKVISPKFEEFSDKYSGKAYFIKVDVDRFPNIVQPLSVSAMPTFMVFKNSQKVDEVVGADVKKLELMIQKYAA
ncbi:thioredoxin-like protein, partial [Basidiobolus meristosporus CBS 931.73]